MVSIRGPAQLSAQERERLAMLAGRGLPPDSSQLRAEPVQNAVRRAWQPAGPGGPQHAPLGPEPGPKPYQYPQLTESQQSRAGWMGPIQFLTGAFNKNPGQALMGAMTGREDYESGALYDNYLDLRLKDPTLTKVQRDALYARRHKEESFSSTYGPFNAYSSAARSGTRTPMQMPGGQVQDYIRRAGQPDEKWGGLYPRNADQGVKRPTAKDRSHMTDIETARRLILSRDPDIRAQEMSDYKEGIAEDNISRQYDLASSAGHPELDLKHRDFLYKLYGDLSPYKEPVDDLPAGPSGPGILERGWGAVKGAGGSLYDSMTGGDPMGQTDDEKSALSRLEDSIREREGYYEGIRY